MIDRSYLFGLGKRALALVLGVAVPAQAQVVINERVEIKTQDALSKRQDDPDNPRRGPLVSAWAEPYVIETGPPPMTVLSQSNAVTRAGYLNIVYSSANWLNVADQGQIRVEVHRDSLLRTVIDTFSIDTNFDEMSLVERRRCVGFGGPDIDYELPVYSNTHLVDPFIFQKDSVEIAPESILFDAGRLFPGDTVIVSFITNTGEYGNQSRSQYSSWFEYERIFNDCRIDPNAFQYQSMRLNAYFEWTINHFKITDDLPGTPLAQNDSTRFRVESFCAGRLFPGDTVIVSFITNTGEYGNQSRSQYSSWFEYERIFNDCRIDPNAFQYQSMRLNAYFEWTINHFKITDDLPGTPLAQNDSTRFRVRPLHEDSMTVAPFDPNEMVRVELDAEGARLGYLKGLDGTTGASLDLPFSQAEEDVFYFANDSDPSVILNPRRVKITVTQIDDEVITGERDIFVGGHTFEIVVVPDTVEFEETGQVTVTAIDKKDSTLVNLPDSTPLYVVASDNTLITPDSVFAPFVIIPYGLARSGQLQVKVTNPSLPLTEPNILDAQLFAFYFYQNSVLINGEGTFTQRYDPRIELELPDSVFAPFVIIPYGLARSGQLQVKVTNPSLPLTEPNILDAQLFAFYFYQNSVLINGEGTFTQRYDPRIELEYDKAPDTYLPNKNDLIEVTATVFPTPPPGSMVTFELTQADDFTFEDSTVTPKMEQVVGNEAKIIIKSQEYWGVVKVKATSPRPGQADLEDEKQLPTDTDNDGIADSWELDAANGGTLALGGSMMDQDWDEEVTNGTPNNGDGFTKLGEYQGVMIGMDHQRMTPEKKEIFADIQKASEGPFAIAQIEAQLGLKVYLFEGISPTGIYSGSRNLKYLGFNFARGFAGRLFVRDQGSLHMNPGNAADSTDNGIAVQGTYLITRSLRRPSSFSFQVGKTTTQVHSGGGLSDVYEQTISNIWTNNYISEVVAHVFAYSVVSATPNRRWTSIYNGTDLDGNGPPARDLLNPFDLLSASLVNDAVDGISAGFTQQQYLQAVTLHEVGHALGMDTYVGRKHPLTGPSVMRSGWGPERVLTFSADDILQLQLK